MEVLGSHFEKYSIIIGTPADPAEVRRLATPGEAVNSSNPLEAYLHLWRSEAAQGRSPRSHAAGAPYTVHFVLNETQYGVNCTRFFARGHRRRICKIARARNAVMAASDAACHAPHRQAVFDGPVFADAAFLVNVDSDMCHQWDMRVRPPRARSSTCSSNRCCTPL
eukprot:7391918-Prymnesium_polylepis.2